MNDLDFRAIEIASNCDFAAVVKRDKNLLGQQLEHNMGKLSLTKSEVDIPLARQSHPYSSSVDGACVGLGPNATSGLLMKARLSQLSQESAP